MREDGGEAVVKIVEPVMIEARVLRGVASWADWGQVGLTELVNRICRPLARRPGAERGQ